MKRLTLALVVAILAGCSDPETASKALQDAGYTDIKLGGAALLGCAKGDEYSTKFEARGPTGREVKGVVCSGLFKGATIRTF